jgi:hypothetical protein
MCTVLLPPGVNTIAVKYIIPYHIISYHIKSHHIIYHITHHISYMISYIIYIVSYHISYHITSHHTISYIIPPSPRPYKAQIFSSALFSNFVYSLFLYESKFGLLPLFPKSTSSVTIFFYFVLPHSSHHKHKWPYIKRKHLYVR